MNFHRSANHSLRQLVYTFGHFLCAPSVFSVSLW